jgi:hypothetical protein
MKCYVELHGTRCTIEEAKSIDACYRAMLREYGTDSEPCVRKATEEDIVWVMGMQGCPSKGEKE